ncbi:MAG: cobalamin biosynthesis protein CbiM [Dorea sp.]|nr:cobalamin biosynthesis protein CbiM [Dorea sp.]
MHMADALVSPAVAGTMYAVSAAAAAYSVKEIKLEDLDRKVPAMGVMGAFVFAAQMINFTIPGTGSSGHLCGGMLLSAVLGPCAGFLTMIAILAIQCLLFADGGLLALGCNVWNMAFYGCFVGGFLIWRMAAGRKMTKGRITAASVIGCIAGLQLGAFSVTIETLLSGITELPFAVFIGMMQPIHLAIGLVEGLITAAVLVFIYEARPEILYGYAQEDGGSSGRMSRKGTVTALFAAALVIGGVVSLFASGYPDGLEWSMEKVAGTTELFARGNVYQLAERLQGITAVLPDYAFKTSDSAAGTSFSGIVGGIVVLTACFFICVLIKKVKRSK